MAETLDDRLLNLARRRGLVDDEAVACALRECGATAPDQPPPAKAVLEWLASRGILDRRQLAALEVEASVDSPTHALTPAPQPPPWRGERIPEVPPDWGRYTNFSVIGEGGMGTVYRAFDPRLQRWVALKFLRADDRRLAEECLREARAQARVDHENVCQIYEVGEVARRLYISMQYIEGRTLRSLAGELSAREVAQIAAQVARALHAAHLEGLVHRDVKPSNIMVERTADGRWRPYVLDFGLARDLTQASGNTMTGAVLGTPSYMAPEQARGDVHAIDPRTDVYSLGATLYDVLAGAPPFDGSIAEVLVRVLQDDAPPLRQRRPSLPMDLAAIVDRCMEKDPSRRYPNALAVAEDLERFLAGEPVAARRRSTWYLLARRMGKQRVAVAAAALALLAIGGAAFVTVSSVLAVRRQAELSQTFARELVTLEESVRLAYSRPLHDVRPELNRVRQRLDWIATEAKRAGQIGAGPGHHALGKGYLALGETARAEEHLRRAWDHGYRPPEVAHALALVLIARYREALAATQGGGDPDLARNRRQHLDLTYRRPALAFLEKGRDAALQAPELAEAEIAFLEERYDEALAKAELARQRIPWLYRTLFLAGEVHRERARAAITGGALDEALALLDQAATSYRLGIAQAPSDPAGYSGLCETANITFLVAVERGLPAEPRYREALAACDRALEANPDHLAARLARTLAHLQWAQYLGRRGLDATLALAEASAEAAEIVQEHADDALAWTYLGTATRLRADLAAARGADPSADLEEACQQLRRALAIEPTSWPAANNLGLALLSRGLDDLARGKDPRSAMHEAASVFQTLADAYPRHVAALDNLSVALWAIGRWEAVHGGDPGATFDRAEAVLRRALEVNPTDGVALNNLGLIDIERAAWLLDSGGDPTAALAQGRAALERAIELNPEDPFAYTNLGQLHRLSAAWAVQRGAPPRAALGEARRALARARAINPADAEAAMAEGLCYLVEARASAAAGRRVPEGLFRQAHQAFQDALAINPAYREARRELARLHLERAAAVARQSGTVADELQAGLQALEGLATTPDILAVRGELYLHRARHAGGAERGQMAQLAAAALAAALEGNPRWAARLSPLLEEARALAR